MQAIDAESNVDTLPRMFHRTGETPTRLKMSEVPVTPVNNSEMLRTGGIGDALESLSACGMQAIDT
jgi:hypothetical protein